MATDLFGRSTSYGLGTDGTFDYIWVNWDTFFSTAADSTFYVDGSQLVLPGDHGVYDSYIIQTPALAKQGSVSYDFYFPVPPTPDDVFAEIGFYLEWDDERAGPFNDPIVLPFGFATNPDYDITVDPHIYIGFYYNGQFGTVRDTAGDQVDPVSIAIETGNWYTLKASYNITARSIDLKMWKRGTTEPAAQVSYQTNDANATARDFGTGYATAPLIDFYYSGAVESYLDNVTFEARGFSANAVIVSRPGFTADAVIALAGGSIAADAILRRARTGTANADAVVAPLRFGADAFFVDSRPLRHFYDRDHTGTQNDSTIELTAATGPYPVGLTLAQVLADLTNRIPEAIGLLGSTSQTPVTTARNRHVRSADHTGFQALSTLYLQQALPSYAAGVTVASVIADLASRSAARALVANAVIKRTSAWPTSDFAIFFDAVLVKAIAGSHSANAVLRKGRTGSFTANAVLA